MFRLKPKRNEPYQVHVGFIVIQHLFLFFRLTKQDASNFSVLHTHSDRCEPLSISLCRGLPYNQTMLPNLLGHSNQQLAALELHRYQPLVKLRCSPHLQMFICTFFAPVCTELASPIPPCRNLCEAARSGCEKFVGSFSIEWSKEFDCAQFPTFGGSELCIWKPNDYSALQSLHQDSSRKSDGSFVSPIHKHHSSSISSSLNGSSSVGGSRLRFSCPVQMSTNGRSLHQLPLPDGRIVHHCGFPCNHLPTPLTSLQRYHLNIWIGSWALVGCLFTLFTLFTFLIDSKRFRYPEKQIVFIAFCQLAIALLFLYGYFSKDSLACTRPDTAARLSLISTGGGSVGNSSACALVAMLIYYFVLASAVWWTLLTITWCLESKLRWSPEALEEKSHLLHLIGWTFPALMAIVLVAMDRVEGDPLSGVCLLGFVDKSSLQTFFLWPLSICLVTGVVCIGMALVELWRIRKLVKREQAETLKLEHLMLKITAHSLLHCLPLLSLLFCFLCEQNLSSGWTFKWLNEICLNPEFGVPCPPALSAENSTNAFETGGFIQTNDQVLKLFMVKYFCLVSGSITSAVWLWSEKTAMAWQQFCCKLGHKLKKHENNCVDKSMFSLEHGVCQMTHDTYT